MPIRPKHSLDATRPVAQRQFTDREDFVLTFRKALGWSGDRIPSRGDSSHVPRDAVRAEPRILVYYGIGGIGKTSLRRELAGLLRGQANVVQALLDFDLPGYRSPETGLFVLREALSHHYHVRFPTFDIAYAAYWQKTHPQTPLAESGLPFLEEGEVVAEVLEIASELPLIRIIPSLTALAVKGGKALQDWWQRRGQAELRSLPGLEPTQVLERLPMFWAADVKDFITRKQAAAVLFLDTYEALAEGERSEARVHLHDAWIRELIAQLPEVLWVVCGREKLRWAELDPDWESCLDQHLVGGLAESDVRHFLGSCGVVDPALRAAIFEGSEGVPYYLDLMVDTWVQIREDSQREPVADDFARTPRDVLSRLLRHLTPAEVDTLTVLSVPRYWDYGVFELLVTGFHTGYPPAREADLRRFSFITEARESGTGAKVGRMHQVMRHSLQEQMPPEFRRRVHEKLFDYHARRLEPVDARNITGVQKQALDEAFYNGRLGLDSRRFLAWFEIVSEPFNQAAEWRRLDGLWSQMVELQEQMQGSESAEVMRSLNQLTGLHFALGRFAEAEPPARRALAIGEKVLGPEHPDLALSLFGLGTLLTQTARLTEGEPLLRRALAIRERAFGPEHPQVAEALSHLANNLAIQAGYAEAEALYRRTLAISRRQPDTDRRAVMEALDRLAGLLRLAGNLTEAEALSLEAQTIREQVLGPDHPERIVGLVTLGRILMDQGRYTEAEPLERSALAVAEKTLGPEHWETALALHELASVLKEEGKTAEAEPLVRRALAILELTHGPDHPKLATVLNTLASILMKQDRVADAEALYRRALAIYERVQGPNHPSVLVALNNLARTLIPQTRYAEADALFRRALAIGEGALGPEHSRVALVLNGLAESLEQQGRKAEAEPLLRRVLAIREKTQGPDHAAVVKLRERLAAQSK